MIRPLYEKERMQPESHCLSSLWESFRAKERSERSPGRAGEKLCRRQGKTIPSFDVNNSSSNERLPVPLSHLFVVDHSRLVTNQQHYSLDLSMSAANPITVVAYHILCSTRLNLQPTCFCDRAFSNINSAAERYHSFNWEDRTSLPPHSRLKKR